MARWIFLLSALGCFSQVMAIEAPAGSSPQVPAQDAPRAAITPTDERDFVTVLQRSSHHRNLTGLEIAREVIDTLARGDIAPAVATLSKQASGGNHDADIALVRIQHWCNRITSTRTPDPQAQISRLPPALDPARAARAAGVLIAEAAYRQTAGRGCAQARFDFGGIEARLREAAAAGDPASATELAQFTRDPAQKEALLQSAADKGFAPAQYVLATNRLIAVQRGQTTENVASIRLLLKQAGRTVNKAKIDLANCMALGCDGHPADAPAAAAFGTDAARDGEPSAFLSMARMPWGMRMNRAQLLAWQYFGDRLNEAGCAGDNYVSASIAFAQTITAFERQLNEQHLTQARTQADQLWQEHAGRAMREQGCATAG